MVVIVEADNGGGYPAGKNSPSRDRMDITMAGMDGMEATRQIKALRPECKVLALTVHADEQYFFQMLAAGAEGYVTKQVAAEELVEAIRAVAAGNVYLPALAHGCSKIIAVFSQSPRHQRKPIKTTPLDWRCSHAVSSRFWNALLKE
jgi:DNA-binding NarL/FixJ family response regulator